jgi:hypothetical protein
MGMIGLRIGGVKHLHRGSAMPATSLVRVALLLASVVGAAACGLENLSAPQRHAPALLLVENRSGADVIVYLTLQPILAQSTLDVLSFAR